MKRMTLFTQRTSMVIFTLVTIFFAFVSCRKYSEQIDIPERCEDCGFISLWEVGDNKEITIPVNNEYKYDYTIFWSKQDNPRINARKDIVSNHDYTLKLPDSGKYLIKISGNFPAIYFGSGGKKLNGESLLEVRQWGNIEWKSMNHAFYNCSKLKVTAKDSPNLSKVRSMESMFQKANSFNQNINNWNVGNVTNMKNLFRGAYAFNQPLDKWNVGNVTNMEGMFKLANSFNQNINSWNVSKVNNMRQMFDSAGNFNQPLDKWNVSNVINMKEMFIGTIFNQDLNSWKLNSNVTSENSGMMFSSDFNIDNIKSWGWY